MSHFCRMRESESFMRLTICQTKIEFEEKERNLRHAKELIKEAAKPNRALRAWEIVLLVLGSPIWLSLLIAAVAVVLSVYIVLWSVIISLYAVAFSLAACGVAGVAVFPIFAFKGDMAQGVFLLGCGLVCAGLAILMFMLSKYATKGIVWLSCKIWFLIKRCFVRRGNSNENI